MISRVNLMLLCVVVLYAVVPAVCVCKCIGLREGVLSTYHKACESRQVFAIRFHSHYSHLVLEEETIALPRGAIS